MLQKLFIAERYRTNLFCDKSDPLIMHGYTSWNRKDHFDQITMKGKTAAIIAVVDQIMNIALLDILIRKQRHVLMIQIIIRILAVVHNKNGMFLFKTLHDFLYLVVSPYIILIRQEYVFVIRSGNKDNSH